MSAEAGATRLAGVRRVIAQRMMQSLATTAQLTYQTDVDITELLARRGAWKAAGLRVGVEDCAIAALARALVEHPLLNATLEGEFVRLETSVDVSVAIAVGGGLMTPVIRDAAGIGLAGIAAARADLVARARAGVLKVSDMKGGTTTISNLGLTPVRHFTPILNAGQPTLLGLGRIETRLVRAASGEIVDRQVIGLSLTADHRLVDGEPAGRFLGEICQQLQALDV
ncbi:MAG: 2-oxo acid dehydrogenase subunit E2 [Phenylobacterium sp.]|uniref:2-oxo acid dehydrogenase subunit E2 n=1 Tax=Phenylobacterium sp. TaxID=1871053 RepID=UPI00273298C5|nr:2-oxo acid dehydrogenase subunit E2 [Phenylobacterium sp.]MDP3746479.1 2-oxo acid dehydrogenase subunit E2 [Phenylobacterium sp.]